MEKDKARWAGRANEWRNYQLKIALASTDDAAVVKFARKLILQDSHHDKMEYYQLLKARISKKEWESYLDELISGTPKSYAHVHQVAKFYVAEKWYDKLFQLVKQAYSIDVIKEYESYLAKDYTPELVALCESHIRRLLSENVGRNHYKNAVRKIRWIKKLGDVERVENLVALDRHDYKPKQIEPYL
ncbi:MAG TPA: hypothetical protein ENH91_03495 [Leeuwenhoekiella sp.]|nr:hypothetical protein [Leeuwenhoekiella sp.]